MTALDEVLEESSAVCEDPGHVALLYALESVYSGAGDVEAQALADALESIGFAVVEHLTRGDGEIRAFDEYRSNADVIAAVARLGYLRDEDFVLDPTWGKGTFWRTWQPRLLQGSDLDAAKSPTGSSVDATNLPYPARHFDAVVLDPPYKLNGTPTAEVDERYGVHEKATRAEREQLILDMVAEGARVAKRSLLVKGQDQVNGGKVRWQTDEIVAHAALFGFHKVDELVMLGGRPQPAGRRQVHARRNGSALLVLERTNQTAQTGLLDPT